MIEFFTSFSISIAFSRSPWSPMAMVDGLWIMIIPVGLMRTSSPAIAMTEAADAARLSTFTVTCPL